MSEITPVAATTMFTCRSFNSRRGWMDGWMDLEREAGLLVLVEVGGVDGVEGPDEAEDPQEDPPQQVVAEPKAEPGALRGHPLVHERQRGPRRRGHRARGGEQRRASGLGADGGRVLGVAAPHPLAPRPQLGQPCGQRGAPA